MSKQTKHTPMPWVYRSGMIFKSHPEIDIPIARMARDTPDTSPTERDANAEFIVLAVNAHEDLVKSRDDLLEACKFAKAHIKSESPKKALPVLRAAIAKEAKP